MLAFAALVGLSVHRLSQTPGAGEPAAAGATPELLSLSGATMGTRYNAKVVRKPADRLALSAASVKRALEETFSQVDRAMSTYRPDSELSRFNRSSSTSPVALSAPLRNVFAVALEVGHASGGALDVTLAPLVSAWGFGPDAGAPQTPKALAELQKHAGLDKLALSSAGLRKAHPKLACDLSAVAKGYAVDLAAQRLRALGAQDFLLEVGGELYAQGTRPDGKPWRVGIERPSAKAPGVARVVSLDGLGMATSGDYRNFRVEAGERVSHLLDPRTGEPVSHGLASVTVVHARVALADAWATALSVLGPSEGLKMAEAHGLAAQLVERVTEDQFSTKVTKGFAAMFGSP